MLIPITQSTDNLSDALDDSILVDDVDSDLFFDALEEVDCNVDTFVDIGDYTFSIQDPCTPFFSPDEGTLDGHGECIYCHVLGASINIYRYELEDDPSPDALGHTFLLEDPSTPFSFLTQGTTDVHGEHIYYWDQVHCHDTPHEFWIDNTVVWEDNSFLKYVCELWIRSWQYKSYYQQQNCPRNVWQSLRLGTNRFPDFTRITQDIILV